MEEFTLTDDGRERVDRIEICRMFSDNQHDDDHMRWSSIEGRLQKLIGCITQGLMWMHSGGIQQQDLKPQISCCDRARFSLLISAWQETEYELKDRPPTTMQDTLGATLHLRLLRRTESTLEKSTYFLRLRSSLPGHHNP